MKTLITFLISFFALNFFEGTEAQAFLGKRCAIDMHTTLDNALANAKKVWSKRRECSKDFDMHFKNLLTLAQGYPDPSNKQKFSDFLVSLSDSGIITRQKAEDAYNRYFSVKFVAMMTEYNLCSSACSNEEAFRAKVESELADKELGLQKICRDSEGFARSNRLYADSMLVINATCRACVASR